jgi:preprotein translocase subunit SecA
MDYLQEGIGLRAVGQRDPLVEYQREGFDLFASMMDGIKEESVGFLFNVEVQVDQPPAEEPAPPMGMTIEAEQPAPPAEPALGMQGLGGPTPLPYGAAEPGADPILPPEGATPPTPAPMAPSTPAPVAPPTPAPMAPPTPAPVAPQSPQDLLPRELTQPHRPSHVQYSAPSVDGGSSIKPPPADGAGPRSMVNAGEGNISGQATGTGPARNGPCPCGSGRKYKKCHGAPGGVATG